MSDMFVDQQGNTVEAVPETPEGAACDGCLYEHTRNCQEHMPVEALPKDSGMLDAYCVNNNAIFVKVKQAL